MHEGEWEHKEWKGQSEVVGMQVKWGRYSIAWIQYGFSILLGQECRFIYMY